MRLRFWLSLLLLLNVAVGPSAAQESAPGFPFDHPEKTGYSTIVWISAKPGDEARTFTRLGFACAQVNLSEQSCTRALEWLHNNLKAQGGDPDRIFLVGAGQGGQLAVRLGNKRSAQLRGILAIDSGLSGQPPSPFAPLLMIVKESSQSWKKGKVEQKSLAYRSVAQSLAKDNSVLQKAVRHFLIDKAPPVPVGLKGVKFVRSPNWEVRSVGCRIDTIVVHATVINSLQATIDRFLDGVNNRVSAHYVVDRDGTTVQMVDENLAAWHAGVSLLEGRTGLNDFSVGVELVNLNDGKDPFTDAQYQALARIVRDLRSRWTIPDSRIVSHAQIAKPAGRKTDPLGFDFPRLYKLASKSQIGE